MPKLILILCITAFVFTANAFADEAASPPGLTSNDKPRLKFVDVAHATVVRDKTGVKWDYALLDLDGDGSFDDYISKKRGSDLIHDKADSRYLLVVLLIEETVSANETRKDILMIYKIANVQFSRN